MTALNVIVQPHAAHLITDAAVYDPDGVIIRIVSKVFVFGDLNAALAINGKLHPDRARAFIEGNPCRSQADLKNLCREIVHQFNALNVATFGDCGTADGIRLAAIAWNATAKRPEAWTVSSHGMGPKGTEDGRLYVGHVGWLSPPPASMADYEGRWDTLDPDTDGRRILEDQRAGLHTTPNSETPRHIVGGFGERVTVSAAGLTWATLIEWPEDEIGQPIRPKG